MLRRILPSYESAGTSLIAGLIYEMFFKWWTATKSQCSVRLNSSSIKSSIIFNYVILECCNFYWSYIQDKSLFSGWRGLFCEHLSAGQWFIRWTVLSSLRTTDEILTLYTFFTIKKPHERLGFVTRKFSVAQSFLCYYNNYRKTKSNLFPIVDILLCTDFADSLYNTMRVQYRFTNFHSSSSLSAHLSFLSSLRSTFRSLGS